MYIFARLYLVKKLIEHYICIYIVKAFLHNLKLVDLKFCLKLKKNRRDTT